MTKPIMIQERNYRYVEKIIDFFGNKHNIKAYDVDSLKEQESKLLKSLWEERIFNQLVYDAHLRIKYGLSCHPILMDQIKHYSKHLPDEKLQEVIEFLRQTKVNYFSGEMEYHQEYRNETNEEFSKFLSTFYC